MDNFKFNKRKKPNSSIDGFISPGSTRLPGDLFNFRRYYKPEKQNIQVNPRSIDSFSKSIDGFAPAVNPRVQTPNAKKPDDVTSSFEKISQEVNTQEVIREKTEKQSKQKRGIFKRKKHSDKSKHKTKPTKFKKAMRISAAFGAFLILVFGGLALKAYLTSRGIFKGGGDSAFLNNGDIDPSQLNGEGDGRVNILLMGKGGEGHEAPDLTDTIIVASIDPLAKEASLLSIPRDFWVKSQSGRQTKINQVYYDAKQAALNKYSYQERNSSSAKQEAETAGTEAMKRMVSETMGVPIHYYAMIDFRGFRKAVDTVGGIDINVTEKLAVKEQMRIDGRNYYLNVGTGKQHFDGFRALAFSRSRKTSTAGDFARAERQRAVIVALKEKVLTVGTLANPLKLNQLMSDFSGNLSTDFSVNELLRLYDLSKEIPSDKVASVGLDDLVTGDMINGMSVQIPKAGLFSYSDIQDFVRNVMRDAFLKKEDSKIIILNGTSTPGLATRKSKELKSFGYNIISVGDAPTSSYTNTVLVDLRNGNNKYTLNYLQKRLGVTAVNSLPDSSIVSGEADFVIILGSDANR